MKAINAHNKELVIISLGDGDFTWSLDFVRYLVATNSSSDTTTRQTDTSVNCDDIRNVDDNRTSSMQQHEQQHNRWWDSIRFIVSGIDPIDEFQEKYRNYKYVLRELLRLNSGHGNDSCQPTIQVDIKHEVNAIYIPPSSASSSSTSSLPSVYPKGHIIFFHHPHLGVEDAQLHTKFLFHLFYSIQEYWLVKKSTDDDTDSHCSIFYLTLANGQYERWNCYMAAKRHRMKLVQEFTFVSSPEEALHTINSTTFTTTMNKTPHRQHKLIYGQRRHQTGKSFASRTCGSTTYAFVREDDYDRRHTSSTKNDSCFVSSTISIPWFMPIDHKVSTASSNINATTTSTSPYSCSICHKSFREERSLKNHIKSVHEPSHNANSKRIRSNTDDSNVERYVCHQCANGSRKFDTFVALQDHIRAKHSGLHTSIQPDWIQHRSTPAAIPNTPNNFNISKEEDQNQSIRVCCICDATFTSASDEEIHYKLFIPSTTTGTCALIDDNPDDTNITTSTTATKTTTSSKIECRFCFKRFQQIRAQQQHENFCSSRPKHS